MKDKAENTIYKVRLFDKNCPSCCSDTFFFFVEDLAEFEKHWLPLAARNPEQVERYYRSKLGEIVTDYYSDSSDLNIVQQAPGSFLAKKVNNYTDKTVTLTNAYGCKGTFEFDSLTIEQRVLQYGDKHYLVGQYRAKGCKQSGDFYNTWYDTDVKYREMSYWGNPIAEYRHRDINWDDKGSQDAYKDFYTNDKNFYKHDTVKTFVYFSIIIRNSIRLICLSDGISPF